MYLIAWVHHPNSLSVGSRLFRNGEKAKNTGSLSTFGVVLDTHRIA
jgi:hypothetical protein